MAQIHVLIRNLSNITRTLKNPNPEIHLIPWILQILFNAPYDTAGTLDWGTSVHALEAIEPTGG